MNIKTCFMICVSLFITANVYAGTAVAELKGIASDSRMKGKLKFTEEKGGVVVLGEFSKAPTGKHGIHIHEKGSCEDAGRAAGGHLNPSGNPHGYAPKDFPLHSHPGDMGNIQVDIDGNATYKVHMPELGLAASSRYDIRKRAVIITEKEDDFSQPAGNSGVPIACGVIEEA
jgi:superoxide dismutase, Cu-Zn family